MSVATIALRVLPLAVATRAGAQVINVTDVYSHFRNHTAITASASLVTASGPDGTDRFADPLNLASGPQNVGSTLETYLAGAADSSVTGR